MVEFGNFLLNLNSKFMSGSKDKNNRIVFGSEERLCVDVDDGG